MRSAPTSAAAALRIALSLAAGLAALAPPSPWIAAALAQPAPQRARELFKQSEESYRAGRFQEAIDRLREAYALDRKPVLLYNMARAYEGLGDTRAAVDAYKRYLEAEPATPDRGALEQRIATLERQQAEREALERKRDAAPAAPAKPAEPLAPARPASPVPWIVAGVGALGVGAGVVLGVMARGRHEDAVDEQRALEAIDLQDQADTLALAANVAWIAGAVVATGAVVWGIVDVAGSGPASPRATVGVGPGVVVVRGRF